MDIDKIKNANTNKIGKKIEYYKSIESTHKYAQDIAQEKGNDGKIIIAEIQTAGIGTKGRKWYTGEGKNIALTIILQTKKSPRELKDLPIKVAEVIKKSIKELYGYELKIKLPNDLMIDNKKISGILTQIATQGETIKYVLISFGFNVNEDNFDDEVKDIATSLKKQYNKNFNREDIICTIIENLEKKIEL